MVEARGGGLTQNSHNWHQRGQYSNILGPLDLKSVINQL
jgi:hypothetical protein